MSFGPLTDKQKLFMNNLDLSRMVPTSDAFHAEMFPEDRVNIHHIQPPKKTTYRSGRPGGTRSTRTAALAENASMAISSLNNTVREMGATLEQVRAVMQHLNERSDAMWKLIGPIPYHASLLTVTDSHTMMNDLHGDIRKEMEEMLGGLEVRLQEVEEDLYGNA